MSLLHHYTTHELDSDFWKLTAYWVWNVNGREFTILGNSHYPTVQIQSLKNFTLVLYIWAFIWATTITIYCADHRSLIPFLQNLELKKRSN
jgi:hypothetical protein